MLQVQRWVGKNTCVVAEGETQMDVFQQLVAMQEVFGETKCGKCHGEDLQFRLRKATKGKKEFTYPELVCRNPDCRAKLTYGQAEGGVLFPIRYEREKNEDDVTVYKLDKDGRKIKKGTWGWCCYNKDTGEEE